MSISESQRLESLYRIARVLHDQDMNVRSILQTVLSMAGQSIGAQHGCVVTFNSLEVIDQAYILGESDNNAHERKLWETLISQGLIGFVAYGHRTVVIRNLQTDPRWPHLPENAFIPGSGSAIGLPLEKNGHMLGVVILVHDQVDYFTHEIIDMLEAIANICSAAVSNAVEFNSTHASSNRYQWLFNDSIVPIILTDLHGNVVDANRQACAFLEYDHADIKEQHIALIHRMGTGPIGVSRFSSLQTGKEIEFRTTAWTESGAEIPVLVRARRLSFGDEDVIEWVEQDISAQLELEQLRGDLSAMVYHDLRGPLQTINNSLALLHRLLGKQDNHSIPELIQVGIRSVRRLSRMVESLLDIQRLGEGKAVLDCKTVSLHSLLAEAAQLVQPLALEVNQELSFDVNEEMPWLNIDSDMILRVVTNLLENAIKYTPENGIISLSARVRDGAAEVSVTDSGPGIPPHMQRQIFDKFSRVKYTDSPRGLGLGLAFCRLAVEAHGGRIWVESEPGQGSTFLFALPLRTEQAPAILD